MTPAASRRRGQSKKQTIKPGPLACWAIALLAEIKAQFNAHSGPPRGWVMLKTISKAGFDVVAVLTMIVTVFYLAAITHIMPLPANVLSRINEFSLKAMDVLLPCGAWVIRIFE
jgi:hypothetical protein